MDGIDDRFVPELAATVAPIIDQIEEFKVNSHNDQAEFGGVLGGVINVVTKSGTNQFYVTAPEFLRNNDFDARNTFYSAVTPYRQNQFGVAYGVLSGSRSHNGKNRLSSFIFKASGYANSSNYLHLPTATELSGNLAGEAQAFNPFSTPRSGHQANSSSRSPAIKFPRA